MKNFEHFYDNLVKFENFEAIIDHQNIYTYKDVMQKVLYFEKIIQNSEIHHDKLISISSSMSFNSICLFLCLCKMKKIIIPISNISTNKKNHFQNISNAESEICFKDQQLHIQKLKPSSDYHQYYQEVFKRNTSGLVVFSSGSTGDNKAAVHDLNFIFEKFTKKRSRMRILSFLLYDHLGGINTFLYTLSNGGCLIIPEERSPESVLRNIQNFKAELLPTSPSFINFLLMSDKIHEYDLSSLKIISYGTELMHEHTLKKARDVLPNVKLLQTYGLTEIGVLRSKSLSSDSLWVKLGGKEFETRVVDGKLQIKGNSTMLGYLNHKNPFTNDGWLITNDNVEVQGEYYRILGRDSDIINVGGQKVYPAEVENIILQIDQVSDVSIFSEPNPLIGNIVCANITVDSNQDTSNIKKIVKKYCSSKLEKYKVPMKIRIVKKIQNTRFKRVRGKIDEN